jgi:2-methylisocitrate lyase-like PEP mutase family enzyme
MSRILKEEINGPRKLRELMEKKDIILAPGAYDALSARILKPLVLTLFT